MAVTYILCSNKLDRYYIGSTNDLNDRFQRHNRGAEKFTSTGTPRVLAYSEQFVTYAEARRRETEIKKKKSRKYIEWLIHLELIFGKKRQLH